MSSPDHAERGLEAGGLLGILHPEPAQMHGASVSTPCVALVTLCGPSGP